MRFEDLCLTQKDINYLTKLTESTTAGLLLMAEQGFGKKTVARLLAEKLTAGHADRIYTLTPGDSGSISIDQIRQLKKFFVLRSSDSLTKRVALIINADTMTIEAQNAFLKLLEEPPERSHMILTASHEANLLPTIHSRVTTYHLHTPSSEVLHMYLKKQGLPTEASKLASGLPGLAIALASGEKSELTQAVANAKELLGEPMVERLKRIDAASKDKTQVHSLLLGLKIVANGAMQGTVSSGRSSRRWQAMLESILKAQQYIEQNVSAKLVLTDLMLNI